MMNRNITTRVLDFVNNLQRKGIEEYGTEINVTKECTWTPYYAIFIAEPAYAHNSVIQKQLKRELDAAFPDCTIRFNTNLNEIEIEHPDSQAYFDRHRYILEEIGMEYAGWTAFLTND
jgi:hypothetical protein